MTTAKKTSSTAIKRIRGDVVFDVVNASILIVMMLVVLYPLIYVVSCSVSSPLLVVQSKVVLFPKGMTKVAYEHVFNNSLILSGYGNTILYTLIGTSINLVMTIMGRLPALAENLRRAQGHHVPVHLHHALFGRLGTHLPDCAKAGPDGYRVGAGAARRDQRMEHADHEKLFPDLYPGRIVRGCAY